MDAVLLPVPIEDAWLVEVAAGDCADSVGAEELLLVEHDREDPPQPCLVDERGESPAFGVGPGAVGQLRNRRRTAR